MKTQHSVQCTCTVCVVCSGRENVKCYCFLLCAFVQFLDVVLNVKINSGKVSL